MRPSSRRGAQGALTLLLLATGVYASGEFDLPFSHVDQWKDSLTSNLKVKHNIRRQGSSGGWEDGHKPLRITNRCSDTLWPAILTQHGEGPGTGGFELDADETANLWVGSTWQGRVWGRTNCTVNGDSASCETGGCFSQMECESAGDLPATLAEFTLAGGVANQQTFYDISLVDGYNLPMAIKYIPARNTSYIPPNLTNMACIATPGYISASAYSGLDYSNSSYPIPWEYQVSDDTLRDWCPWPLLADPPDKPGDGVYPYPDDNIQRPDFSPCLSQCAATGRDSDCCAGDYGTPDKCSPSRYSRIAKSVCPDAYSYAYDDETSTFIIPAGGGWEVLFCPEGRSTNILRSLGPQLHELAAHGNLTEENAALVTDRDFIDKRSEESTTGKCQPALSILGVVAALATGLMLL